MTRRCQLKKCRMRDRRVKGAGIKWHPLALKVSGKVNRFIYVNWFNGANDISFDSPIHGASIDTKDDFVLSGFGQEANQ